MQIQVFINIFLSCLSRTWAGLTCHTFFFIKIALDIALSLDLLVRNCSVLNILTNLIIHSYLFRRSDQCVYFSVLVCMRFNNELMKFAVLDFCKFKLFFKTHDVVCFETKAKIHIHRMVFKHLITLGKTDNTFRSLTIMCYKALTEACEVRVWTIKLNWPNMFHPSPTFIPRSHFHTWIFKLFTFLWQLYKNVIWNYNRVAFLHCTSSLRHNALLSVDCSEQWRSFNQQPPF